MNVLAFAASNSKHSINRQLANYAASLLPNAAVTHLEINDYEMPLYSIDRERETGIPELAQRFFDQITAADALIIAFAEHNGSYSAAYKNLFDWASRINGKVFQDKPAVFLASSPGASGAASVLAQAVTSAPFFGADVRASLSLPSFNDNFDSDTKRITDTVLDQTLRQAVGLLAEAVVATEQS